MRGVLQRLKRMRTHMHTPEFAGGVALEPKGESVGRDVRPYPQWGEYATTVWRVVVKDSHAVSEAVRLGTYEKRD